MSQTRPRLGTAIVGAGPAGLLFAAVARRRWEQAGWAPEAWTVALFDKRPTYSRTHRLRLDRRPYDALIRAADDPRFDALGAFLEAEEHAPDIAALEAELERLAGAFGVRKQLLAVGDGEGETPLSALRELVLGDAGPEVPFTVVGADSVHSTVRRLVASEPSRAVTHEHLARLVVVGPGVPRRLAALDTYRISKVVASIFDYRCRTEDRAEIDLFLTRSAYVALDALGASPRAPIALDPASVGTLGDPLLRRFLRFLADGFGSGPCAIELHSVFRLEHALAASRAMAPADLGGTAVLLVGDAGASLPFQRGMACLARCVPALADAHLEIADGHPSEALTGYDRAVAAIVASELRVVSARARLVAGLRAFVRISALLPFPIQSWFLSVPGLEQPSGRWTPGLALNGAVALATAAIALGQPALEMAGHPLPVAPAAAVVLGFAGGLVYRATLVFEPPANAWVGAVWRWTIALVLMGGVALAAATSAAAGGPRWTSLLVLWWLIGIAFALGIAFFEWVGRRGFAEGLLDDPEG